MKSQKYFSLKEAKKILPEVKKITNYYYYEVEKMNANINQNNNINIQFKIKSLINEWTEKVKKYGVEIKGLWLLDFDSGDGYYYCWKYDEKDILFFHLYETGFKGRRPIDLLEN